MNQLAIEVTHEMNESSMEKFVYLDGKFFDRVSDRASWIAESFGQKARMVSTKFFVHDICGGSIRLDFESTGRKS